MTEATQCPECGTELGASTPKGLCPKCALKGALELTGDGGEPAAEIPDLQLPRRFGEYVLLAEIARGGMGVVYRARQVSLERIVALKMILAGPFASREFIQRFRAEAQAAASLQHPHIVGIHDVNECEGQHFFTMEYIEGQSLAERVRDRPLPARLAAQYLKTIAEAVHYAHEHGILHRDLKPSNVIIDAFDQPRVTDFGLAKRLNDESELTISGKALGSPAYMPPEQALGKRKEMGPHSDVYAMGALLYHLLTGRAPFSSETMEATLMQVVHNEPACPQALNPNVPRDLETICLKCLDKEPTRRYRTAQEVALELRRFLNGEPIQGRPIGAAGKVSRWCQRNPVIAGLGALTVILSLAGFSGVLWQWWRAEGLARRESVQRGRAEDTVTQLELERAEDLLDKNRAAEAIAYLTRSLRRNPANHIAAARLLSLLGERSFALPATPPLAHDGAVSYAEFSPDGKRVVTASGDKTARLWDVATGLQVIEPLRHQGEVTMARFSPNGLMVATGSKDKVLQLWDSATGYRVSAPVEHDAEISFVEFSADGKHLLTISGQRFVCVWEAQTAKAVSKVRGHKARVTAAHFSPDGTKIVSSTDTEISVWDAQTGKIVGPVVKDRSSIQMATFSPDGTRILAADYWSYAKIWDWTTGQQVGKTLLHPDVVHDAAFSPDGLLIVTACRDGIARLWNAQTGDLWQDTARHRNWVISAQFSSDGLKLLTLALDNTLGVWDTLTGKPLCEPITHLEAVRSARLSPDARSLVTACQNNVAQIWDIRRGQSLPLILSLRSNIAILQFNPDASLLFAGGWDGIGTLWNPVSGKTVGKSLQHQGAIVSACFSPDGQKLLTGSMDNTACLWDVRTGSNVLKVTTHQARVNAVDFAQKGDLFLTGSFDGTARVWDARTGAPVTPPLKHATRVWSARFSPDGTRVATASDDAVVRFWATRTGAALGECPHEGGVYSVAFSPDGTRLLSGSHDSTARIWDVETRRLLHVLKHSAPIYWAGFSRDGQLAATVSSDNTGSFWDVRTGKAIGDRITHQAPIARGMFSQNGKVFATSDADRTVRLWDVPSGKPLTVPLQTEPSTGSLAISGDGRWVTARRSAAVWEIPPVDEPVPHWLLALAEAVGGRRFDEAGTAQYTDAREVLKVKGELDSLSTPDVFARWGRWFLADRATRTISPSSLVTVSNLLQRRNRGSSIAGLVDVLHFWPTNAAVFSRLARLFVQQDAAQSPTAALNAERCLHQAMKLAPNDPEVWLIRSLNSEKIGKLETALVEIARSIELRPGNSEAWYQKGGVLEKQQRLEDACDAYAHAMDFSTNARSRTYTGALDRRYDLLVRLNRRTEAQAVRLITLNIPPRDALCSTNCIDLSRYYNASLTQDWHNLPTDPRGWNLAHLPAGRQTFGDIEFDVRGIIQLQCEKIARDFPHFPESVSAIALQRRCRTLHFLHASIWARALPAGTRIGRYVIHYADHQQEQIPIVHGEDMLEWQVLQDEVTQLPRASVAWRGKTPHNVSIRLFKRAWENPRPEVEISHLDFLSAGTQAAPFLVALTAQP